MREPFEVEVINDIAVIMRVQGQTFMSAETYEPNDAGAISVVRQTIVAGLQNEGAALLGKMVGRCAVQVVDSELGRRLVRDRWLVAVMASFSRSMYARKTGKAVGYMGTLNQATNRINSTRDLVMQAIHEADQQAKRRRETGGAA